MSHFTFIMCIYKCKDINPKMTIDNKKGGNNYEKRIIKGINRGTN